MQSVVDASGVDARVLTPPRNLGRAEAANFGIRAAEGDLVTLHDDDDTWAPGFLAGASGWLEAHPEADAIVTHIDLVFEQVADDGTVTELRREPFEGHLQEVTLFDLLRVNRFIPIGFVYRRRLHAEIGHYNPELPVVEDWDFHLRLAARGPIPVLPGEPLAFWRQRPEAVGVDGNSVIVEHDAHRRFDLLERDAELRRDPGGIGGLLYLTRFLDDRIGELHTRFDQQRDQIDRLQVDLRERNDRIRALEEAVSDASLVSLARRRWRRLRSRLHDRLPKVAGTRPREA